MTFPPKEISRDIQSSLEDFARKHDFEKLYREYSWRADTWQKGFPDILRLETRIANAARNNLVRKSDVLAIAEWGSLRNIQRIECPPTFTLPLYENERPDKRIETDPLIPLRILQASTTGLGPTGLSKVLRFALPSEYGVIDTRIVRMMGVGDAISKRESWLSLRARNDGYGWYIPKNQSAWPREYSKWINILRFFSRLLNDSGRPCPHPEAFSRNGLRTQGIWVCADVEMALFSYASKFFST